MASSSYNRSLHGLRGLAVLLVLVYHVHRAIVTAGLEPWFRAGQRPFRTFEMGCQGVDLFFMISGFLIMGSLFRHRSPQSFLFHRVIRIYPAFLVPHLVVFAAGPALGYEWLAGIDIWSWCLHFLSNLVFLPGVFDLPIAQIVAWSLSYEFCFYLFAAAALVVARSQGHRLLTLFGALTWLSLAILFLVEKPSSWFFVSGVATWWLLDRGTPAEQRFVVRQSLVAAGAQGLVMLGGLAGLLLLFGKHFPLAVVCGTMGFAAICCDGPVARQLFAGRVLSYLGTISFSLYLWHPFVLFAAKRFAIRYSPTGLHSVAAMVLFWCVACGGSLLAGHLSYVLLEQRLTTWFKQLLTSPRHVVGVAGHRERRYLVESSESLSKMAAQT